MYNVNQDKDNMVRNEIFHFANQGETTEGHRTLNDSLSFLTKIRNQTYPECDIYKITGKGGFTERTNLIGTKEWKTTDTVGTTIFNIDPNTLITTLPNLAPKLQYLSAAEFNIRLRIQVNVTPFAQGLLRVNMHVNDTIYPYTTPITDRTYFSSLTGEIINIGAETEVTLVFPYFSTHANFSLLGTISNGMIPSVYVQVYEPLNAVTPIVATVTAYLELEDVRTHMPTATPLRTESMLLKLASEYYLTPYHQRKQKETDLISLIQKIDLEDLKRNPLFHTMQFADEITSHQSQNADQSEITTIPAPLGAGNQEKKEEKDMIDNLISYATPIAKDLIMDVCPIPLNTIEEIPSWVKDPITRLLGFSKPINYNPVQRFTPIGQGNMLNSNVAQSMNNMGVYGNNHLALKPVFQTTDDEMYFNYITSKSAYIDNFTITTATGENTTLWSASVQPIFSAGGAGAPLYQPPLSFAASVFSSWAGDIKFKFIFVKTPIVNCRISVHYLVGWATNTPPPDPSDLSMTPTMVIDVKDVAEAEFVCPYARNNLWCNLAYPGSTGGINERCGLVIVKLQNRMTANASVPNEIKVIVEVSSDNVKFANPKSLVYFPMQNGPTPPPKELDRKLHVYSGPDQIVKHQSTSTESEEIQAAQVKVVPRPLGQESKFDHDRFTTCMGERIDSIKVLIQRFSLWDAISNKSTTKTAKSIWFYPYQFRPWFNHNNVTRIGDYLDYFSAAYAYYRGNVSVMIVPWIQTFTDGCWRVSHYTDVNSIAGGSLSFPLNSRIACDERDMSLTDWSIHTKMVQQANFHGTFDTLVPNYSNSLAGFCHKLDNTVQPAGDVFRDDFVAPSLMCVTLPHELKQNEGVSIYRAAHSNFMFGFWNGVPPMRPYDPSPVEFNPA